MAINDSQKTDFLWKKLLFGVTNTAIGSKAAQNETISSPLVVDSRYVWSQVAEIPETPPASDTTVVEVRTASAAITMVPDPTVVGDKAWIAVYDVNGSLTDPANRVQNWIPPSMGAGYLLKVYTDNTIDPANSLNTLSAGSEWVFDYVAGVLHFVNAVPNVGTGLTVEGYRYIGSVGGTGSGGSVEGVPTFGALPSDGDFDDGRAGKNPAVTGWQSETRIVDAMDSINEILGLLLPDSPDALSTKTLSFPGGSSSVLYADGYTDLTGSGPAAGTQVSARSSSGSITSSTIQDFGSGNSGNLQLFVNGAQTADIDVAAITGTSASDGDLNISGIADFPLTTPGFWKSMDASVSGALGGLGLNTVKVVHTETGETNDALVLMDHAVPAPVATISGVTQGSGSAFAYSSGVPHYAAGSTLDVAGSGTNMATDAYVNDGIFRISGSNSIGSRVDINAGDNALPALLPVDYASHTLSPSAVFTITNSGHTQGQLSMVVRNPNASSSAVTDSTTINVMAGNPSPAVSGPMKEFDIRVSNSLGSGSGNGVRVVTSDFSAWTANATITSDEAAVVGGKLRHDVNNYSVGYLPAGPDYSSHDATQYFTFEFTRSAVSLFTIQINGTYAGVEVALPGVTSGWWDMGTLYGGAGVPNPGCALGSTVTGSSGTFTCTFGTETSTNATGNKVLVRIAMEAGDVINGIDIR